MWFEYVTGVGVFSIQTNLMALKQSTRETKEEKNRQRTERQKNANNRKRPLLQLRHLVSTKSFHQDAVHARHTTKYMT